MTMSQSYVGYILPEVQAEPPGSYNVQKNIDSAPPLRAPFNLDDLTPDSPPQRAANASRVSNSSNKNKLYKFTPKWKTLVSRRGQSDKHGLDSNIRVVSHPTPIVGQHIVPGQTLLPKLANSRDSSRLDHLQQYDTVVQPVASTSNLSSRRRARPPPPPPQLTRDKALSLSEEHTARPSLDSSSTLSPTSSTSTSSLMKQQSAKAPYFSIDSDELHPKREHWAPGARSSVERIAEQYRLLLEVKGEQEEEEATQSDTIGAELDFGGLGPEPFPRRHRSEDSTRPTHVEQTCPSDVALSLSSDEGTLVSMEEEIIYFKPVSCSPTASPSPSSVPGRYCAGQSTKPLPDFDSPSLEICFGMLTRELTSAFEERSHGVGREQSALQVWVMIEAYERLQDQVANIRLQEKERHLVGIIFNSFLAALYSVHDRLSYNNDIEHPTEDVD